MPTNARVDAQPERSATNRAYPVLSYPAVGLEEHAGWRSDIVAALMGLLSASKPPDELVVWCREGIGLAGLNKPCHILFFYVVVPRGGTGHARRIADALEARWGQRCRHEGSYPLTGGERALAGIEDGRVVSYD